MESGLSMPLRLAQSGYDPCRDAHGRFLQRRSRETGGGGVTDIVILSKQPPGGRCSLYLRYAETLREYLGLAVGVTYCDDSAAVPPPAMLIRGTPVVPADGVILSPADIADSLRGRLAPTAVAELAETLTQTQEQWMEEWSDG